MQMTTRKLTSIALIAAAYVAITMLLVPISYGPIQFRVSEVLAILPFFFPAATIAITIGCAFANVFGGYGLPDIIFGTLASFLAGLCTAAIGKYGRKMSAPGPVSMRYCILACLMPVVFSGPIVGAVLAYTYAPDAFLVSFILFTATVGLGQIGVMYLLGLPIMRYLIKNERFNEFLDAMNS